VSNPRPPVFELTLSATCGRQYLTYLRQHLPRAAALLKHRPARFGVLLTGASRMRLLHRRHCNLDSPTDVLTFPIEFDRLGRCTHAEAVVCVPVARQRASEHKTSVEKELLLYALHALLHASGFDDTTDRGFRRMHLMEDRLLIQIGVGAVFGPVSHPSRSLQC